MKGCAQKCTRLMLMNLNFLVIILGAISIGLGCYVLIDESGFLTYTEMTRIVSITPMLVENGAYILIAGGAVAIVFGVFGFAAAFAQKSWLLGVYIIVIGIALALELSAAVLGIVFKETWENQLSSHLQRDINNTFDGRMNTTDEFTENINRFQQTFHCCGIDDYTDFHTADMWDRYRLEGSKLIVNNTGQNDTVSISQVPGEMKLPPSCCKNLTDRAKLEVCVLKPTTQISYFTTSCRSTVEGLLRRYDGVLIGISLALVLVEAVLITAALVMFGSMISNKYTMGA